MRRYDDPVEVRQGWIGAPETGVEGPEQFLWRGRLWQVRAVLAHWVETGPWWQSAGARAVLGSDEPGQCEPGRCEPGRGESDEGEPGKSGRAPALLGQDLLAERELWRVEAGRGRVEGRSGVFDLSFSWADGRWQLIGCAD
jgi:hypothetical protein